MVLFKCKWFNFLNFERSKFILFFGEWSKINFAAYLYNKPEDKNFNLYFLDISFAPVDFPVAAPPSQDICIFLTIDLK